MKKIMMFILGLGAIFLIIYLALIFSFYNVLSQI